MNPVAGGKHKADWETGIRAYFQQLPHRYELYNTTGAHDKESLRYWLNNWKPDKVVAIGGDGTLKLVAEVLLHSDIPLCIFPAGSANGMARELNVATTVDGCLETLFYGTPRKIDVLRINGTEVCIHLSDIGLNAQLVKYFEENDVRGKLGYAREIFRVLWRKRLMQLSIRRDDKTMVRNAFMVVIANAGVYGTGARINPIGDLHDGLFEVVILRKLSVVELLKMLFLNRPFNPEKTELLQAHALTIRVKRKAYFQVDGEYLGKTQQVEAVIDKAALTLIFPPADREESRQRLEDDMGKETKGLKQHSRSGVPPGWDYNPSEWGQRVPLLVIAFIGFLIAAYLSAYQMGLIHEVWEPFFGRGSAEILHSPVSRLLPIPDAVLGALGYLTDLATGIPGGTRRWYTKPWLVIIFGIAVGPLGLASILLVISQPVLYHHWCTLCLISALITVLMISPAMDEMLASLQFLHRVKRKGSSVWKAFWGLHA